MRPFLTGPGANTTRGSFAPWVSPGKSIDTLHREQTATTRVHDNWSPLAGSPYGMYLGDLRQTKYGVERFFKTPPRPMIPLTATLKGYSHQVQNPTLAQKQPGYTYNITTLPTHLTILLNKEFTGATPTQ